MVTKDELKSIKDAISSRTKGMTELKNRLLKYNNGKGYSRQYIYLVLRGDRYNTFVIKESILMVNGLIKERDNISKVVHKFRELRGSIAS